MSNLADTWPAAQEPLPERVSERAYWDQWYEHPDLNLEWNDGRLEEVPVSDLLTGQVYYWMLELLLHYLRRHPVAKPFGLETGFRLALPGGKVSIRKPDLGFIHVDNPIQGADTDNSYKGIPDLVIEALSDSSAANRRRDEVTKKGEYAAVGVREYYILHHNPERLAFYTGAASGAYVPILPQDGVIHSLVFPGFRFRRSDVIRQPRLDALRADPVYSTFVHPEWQQAETIAEQARELVEQARRQGEAAEVRAEQERRQREAAEARAARERATLKARAEQERREREAAEARAEQERRRGDAAEAELAELRAEIAGQHDDKAR
jgi:Uma2 family endonuclease